MTSSNYALISVADKTNLLPLAQAFLDNGINLIATGGTFALLKQNNLPAIELSKFTGSAEMLGGRVKSLHPKIFGGILARRDQDKATIAAEALQLIDYVIVNLYPFAATINDPKHQLSDAIEQIDIGGPSLLRAAAKNHAWTTVVVDPNDYDELLATINNGGPELVLRQKYAAKVFAHTAAYDALISQYFADQVTKNNWPEQKTLALTKVQDLRYGENPQQSAGFYRLNNTHTGLAAAKQLQGKELSFNNLIDADSAYQCVKNFSDPAAVIVKHTNPCGVAVANDLSDAFSRALASDPQSAFGGIVALNQVVDHDCAQALSQHFFEVIIAPEFTEEAQQLFAAKSNLRLLAFGNEALAETTLDIKAISGGYLLQSQDQINLDSLQQICGAKLTDAQLQELHFGWQVVKSVKSNAIVLTKAQQTLGIGAGQTSRIFALEIALKRAQAIDADLSNAVMASDAFFPFKDCVELAAKHGIKYVIQPGGSKNDAEVIAACEALGINLFFTNIRHFRH